MIVRLDLDAGPAAALEQAEDFSRFHVELTRAAGPGELGRALEQLELGRPAGEDVFVTVAALRCLSPVAGEPAWEQGLEKMLAYARDHGWTDADGAVRAHVEIA